MPFNLRTCLWAALLCSPGALSATLKRTEVSAAAIPRNAQSADQSVGNSQATDSQEEEDSDDAQDAAVVNADHPGCTRWNQRKSWNVLSDEEKKAYIDAELCLINSPPRSGTPGARNRFEELQYLHILQMPFVHWVGSFLPWHRYLLKVHEQMLQDECGYQGAQPYWDEIGDQADFPNIPIYDPDTGFGGDGHGPGGCIQDGPFTDVPLHFGTEGEADYCISRDLNRTFFAEARPEAVANCTALPTFEQAWPCLEAAPHSAGHGGTGGIMLNFSTSPGDPLFFPHHAFLDKLYYDWQMVNPVVRVREIGGPNVPAPFAVAAAGTPRFPPSALLDYNGDQGNVTTLDHTLWMNGVAPNITIRDVIDLNRGVSCAEYI